MEYEYIRWRFAELVLILVGSNFDIGLLRTHGVGLFNYL